MDASLEDVGVKAIKMHSESCQNARNVLAELRKTGQLCDAVIKAEDVAFPIHRAILSACSPYFRTLFTNEVYNTEKRDVIIPGITADIMRLVVDYAYTKEIQITADNVEILLPVADQFHVNGLVKSCCDFLTSHLSAGNCIGIRNFARAYFCHILERTAHRFLMHNFTDVCTKSNEFLQLNIDELCEILSSDELNVRTEEIVFGALLRWIDYEPDNRKFYIGRLLRTVRLGLLTTKFFVEKVKSNSYVQESAASKVIVVETLSFLYALDMDEDKEVELDNPLAKPRIPHEILFVVGGWSGGTPTNIVEAYDTRADRWVVCDEVDDGPRSYHGTVSIGHVIYTVGGYNGIDYFNSVRCFNAITKAWSEIAPMHCKRCYVSVTELDGCIYAMGGFDGHHRQNTAERYNPENNQWSLISPMNHQRSDAGSTSFNGNVYICGGFDGQECLDSAETYNPETNQWSLVQPMHNRRSGVGVIAYGEHIYAIGGFNSITRLKTAEQYNPTTNSWQSIPEMYNPRSNFAVEILDEMIFVIGGFNGATTIFNVECYDGASDEWYDATDMNIYRSAMSACVVKGLPNVQDYIHKNRERRDDKDRKRRN